MADAEVFPMFRGPYPDGPGFMNGWRITSYFGGRTDPITGRAGNHGGMDFAFPGCFDQPILAPVGGLWSGAWDPSGGGRWSGVQGHNGDYWGFGHAIRYAFDVGSRWVAAGDIIAFCDSTGLSTGDHVHIAYRPAGALNYRDPYDPLAAALVPDPPPVVVQPPDTPPPVGPQHTEETDMLPAPRKSWRATDTNEWWCLTPNGRLEYVNGEEALKALTTPQQGWPPEILPEPIETTSGAIGVLKVLYNSQ